MSKPAHPFNIVAQREMQSQLNVVGEDVETIRSQVGQVIA